ncbi:ubiquinol-cytochrome c reductase iron-sulfur subunit [Acuticoccus sediminis]|uniref:Ubiquinol-cytochrome c reductase iron-sulfur subunit n=1 Tax=Acuticoccus sediminis TaxID=2184697 RepID=A0A8B2NNM5_9HYPH|nr:ubiquinol-cytochrome c reductase iron-sulfur subunit [Acuticoccus sediminis]RAI01496.1 ubiquinol-cytochrome c reductase iron-sulfur subunit [Acuticoccus sediminis]
MAETVASSRYYDGSADGAGTRRDFLYLATGAVAAVGSAAALWPFIDSMNPAADVLAVSSVEVDLAPIEPGQRVTVKWRGKPVFIDHRPPERIAEARAVDLNELIDPQTDGDRVVREEWLIVVGICTHLGCVPLGQRHGDPVGNWDGWFCPCHGSHYDTAGRVRRGPAPLNLEVPPYEFVTDTAVRIG